MNINNVFSGALSPQLRKRSAEYRVLYLLKHCFPERYRALSKEEAPDLQDKRHSLAIEVTEAIDAQAAQNRSEYVKYSAARTADVKEKSRRIIESNRGVIGKFGLSEPAEGARWELKLVDAAVRAKSARVLQYVSLSGFQNVGLAVLIDCTYDNEIEDKWTEYVDNAQKDAERKFDFFFLISQYNRMVAYYNCLTGERENVAVEKSDWDNIKLKSRLMAEQAAVEYSLFSYGGRTITFYTGKRLDRYLKVKEWDKGYIVVDCRIKGKPGSCEEDYIDLRPILENLYIDADQFLDPIKEVYIGYDEVAG